MSYVNSRVGDGIKWLGWGEAEMSEENSYDYQNKSPSTVTAIANGCELTGVG